MKLNYNLYIGSNPNPKDTNNIVINGELKNNKLVSIDSMKIGDRELVSGTAAVTPVILSEFTTGKDYHYLFTTTQEIFDEAKSAFLAGTPVIATINVTGLPDSPSIQDLLVTGYDRDNDALTLYNGEGSNTACFYILAPQN